MKYLGRLPKDSKLANSPIDTKTKNVDKPVQKKRTITKKVNWSSEYYFPLLKSAVDAYLNENTKQGLLLTNVVVPKGTLKGSAANFSEIMDRGDNVIEFEKITVGMVYPNSYKESILGETDLNFLRDVIVARYEANTGAGRAEIIALIGEISQYYDLI